MKTLLILVMAIMGMNQAEAQSSKVLPVDEFEKMLGSTENKIVLDVRTPAEFQEGHLANAIQVDYYGKDFKDQLGKLDKKKPVFVYCAAGKRSSATSVMLADMGFKPIYDLEGGLNSWKKANKPVIRK